MDLDRVEELAGEPTRNRDLRPRGRETVRRLLAAGHHVVDEKGHDHARIDDIVAHAGLSHGTFYLYFRDREDLLHSLIKMVGVELEQLVDAVPERVSVDDLSGWIDKSISAFDEHAEVLRAARALASDAATRPLVGPLSEYLERGGAVAAETAATMLLCHLEHATVRDDILDVDLLAAVTLRGSGIAA